MQRKSKLVPLLIGINLFTLSLFLVGCPPPPEPNNTCYPAATSSTSFSGLNAMLVYKMAKGYRDRQLSAINNAYYANSSGGVNPTDGDARSVWFDLETVKRFIYEIESRSCIQCSDTDSKLLGIRIYYATYPDSTDSLWSTPALASVNIANAGKHTVMMIPTYRNSAGKDVDFDPQYITSGCNFTAIETFYENMKNNPPVNTILTALSSMNASAQNHGDMIPPPYPSENIMTKGAAIMYAADQF